MLTVIIPLSEDSSGQQVELLLSTWSELCDDKSLVCSVLFIGNEAQSQIKTDAYKNVKIILTQSPSFMEKALQGLSFCVQAGTHGFVIHPSFEMSVQSLQAVIDVAMSDEMVGFISPRTNLFSISQYPPRLSVDICMPNNQFLDKKWCFDAHAVVASVLPKWHVVPTVERSIFFVSHKVLANFGVWDGQSESAFDQWIMQANRCAYMCALANQAFAFTAEQVVLRTVHLSQTLNQSRLADSHFDIAARCYFEGAHYQVESLLLGLLPQEGKISLLLDFSRLGCVHNGTFELGRKVIQAISELHDDRFTLNVVADKKAYEFHRLHELDGVRHVPLESKEKFHIGLMLWQPFSVDDIRNFEQRALKTIYGMLDTIAEDCTYVVRKVDIKRIWSHVCQYATGLFFISQFAQRSFINRYPGASHQTQYTQLLPLTESPDFAIQISSAKPVSRHILVMGNAFDHKGVEKTSKILQQLFPDEHIVAVGGRTIKDRNLEMFKSGFVPDDVFGNLYRHARVIVLPSYVEGFGFGVVHAISTGVPIVTRKIAVTDEILSNYQSYQGILLYDNDLTLGTVVTQALSLTHSQVARKTHVGWREWVAGLMSFSAKLSAAPIDFAQLTYRQNSIDLFGKTDRLDKLTRRLRRVPLLGNWLANII